MKLVAADDPILRRKMPESFTLNHTDILEMFELMLKSKGAGLAAPQVGILGRFFVTYWGEVFINPFITQRSKELSIEVEGCLSLPGQKVKVCRYETVTIGYGRSYTGLYARVIQHELDHLDGKLITDYLPNQQPATNAVLSTVD